MKFSSGKRIGQSGQELVTATIFSFTLHGLILAAAAFLYFAAPPRVYVPPFYEVKLVGLPADVSQSQQAVMHSSPPVPAPQKAEPKPPAPKPKKTVKTKKAPAKAKKTGMPDLAASKHKAEKAEATKQSEEAHEPKKPVPSQESPSQGNSQNVAVATPEDFKDQMYMRVVRDRIGVNWNPPKGAADIKAKVQFTILRSGRVGDVKLEASSGNFYFDQAAVRAILASSPFPQLPDGFYKEFEVFSVDLTEQD